MEKALRLFLTFSLLFIFQSYGQKQGLLTVQHFEETRGDSERTMLLEVPHSQLVVLNNSLSTSSGFGMTLNLFGHVVVVDQMETMADGTLQVVLRREDGKDFYGYRPTIRAILSTGLTPTENPKFK